MIDSKWAPRVRSIYEDFITSGSLFKTMANLRRDNVIHPRFSKPISMTTVSYILRNPVYTGKVRWHKLALPGEHKPIISDELYEHAQMMTKERIRKKRVFKEFLFSGLVKCSSCGSTMTNSFTNKKSGRYFYYRCTKIIKGSGTCPVKQINAEKLEKFLIESILRIARDTDYLESLSLKHALEKPHPTGFELTREYGKYLFTRVQQVLKTAVERLPRLSQIEKCLVYEGLVKQITFSKTSMEVIVVLRDTRKAAQLVAAEGVSCVAAARVRETRPDRPTPDYSLSSKIELVEEVTCSQTSLPDLPSQYSLIIPHNLLDKSHFRT